MKGFKHWYSGTVKKQWDTFSYRELKEIYFFEFINTGNIEIPGHMTKTGNPAIFNGRGRK